MSATTISEFWPKSTPIKFLIIPSSTNDFAQDCGESMIVATIPRLAAFSYMKRLPAYPEVMNATRFPCRASTCEMVTVINV